MQSINPATGGVLRTYEPHSPDEVERRMAKAVEAQRDWSRRPLAERGALLKRIAAIAIVPRRVLEPQRQQRVAVDGRLLEPQHVDLGAAHLFAALIILHILARSDSPLADLLAFPTR